MEKYKKPGVHSARTGVESNSYNINITKKSLIAQIKHEVSIKDVLTRYFQLNISHSKLNRNKFNIRCPFHDDRSPSFTVYNVTNTFRCWAGCNQAKRGDVIDLVRMLLNINTSEAIRTLAIDFSLRTLDAVQVNQLNNRRIEQQRALTLEFRFREEVKKYILELKELEIVISNYLYTIRTEEDMEYKGELYHQKNQVDYWLDCLIDPEPVKQFLALEEIKNFIFKDIPVAEAV
ncbi:CHC2 zinc finger domain-containing protein [Fictibacillus phosphorivorans]|uniref:CHC2 zinc finger domain-containing protein n=1 Tax=Fictibacillus phosphorivorans TaxID=1221500 RepID=UPI0011A250E9|nr:CHC2 zinc finger domain-containing protein [Fictibacillus phosphorivorans]